MKIIEGIVALIWIAFFGSMPIFWIWTLYHKIKCLKVESCKNRKCSYWGWCSHNYPERKKDEIELRKKLVMLRRGITEENLESEEEKDSDQNSI